MCTLTWWREADGSYEVFFNRDEKKTRSVADPPRRHELDGVSFLAPIDPDGGGTWILANQHGLLVCLLNRWHDESPVATAPSGSRGRLVMEMGALPELSAIGERLRAEDLHGMRPFTMVGFDRAGEWAWTWNRRELSSGAPTPPLISSSFRFEEVAAARERRFHEWSGSQPDGSGALEHYHADGGDSPSAYTVRMCRPDAQTMSRSRVRVGPAGVRWVYLEEQADLAGEPRRFEAELR